jgi:hypothetical protein
MATPAQIAANRRNALKSTGPRTAAGKAASSRNALRHGLAARAAVVPGEEPADLARFRAELVTALAPRDAREEWLAEAAVEAAWRLRRVWRAEAALFNRHGGCARSCLDGLLILQRYETAANRRFHRAIAMLERGRTLERVATRQNRPDKLGHDGKGGSKSEKRLSSAVPKPEPDSRGRSPVKTSSRNGCSERRRWDTTAPRRAARNHRFCRRNPIWGPRADAQALEVFGASSIRASRLAFAEKRLISWKTVLKRHRVRQNPSEFASVWPSWAERRAPPPHLQQTALS